MDPSTCSVTDNCADDLPSVSVKPPVVPTLMQQDPGSPASTDARRADALRFNVSTRRYRVKRLMALCAVISCFTFAPAAVFADVAPGSLDEIPLYPGATRAPLEEKQLAEEAARYPEDRSFLSVDTRAYALHGAVTEDVVPWYMRRFALTLDSDEGQGPEADDMSVQTEPDTASRMTWQIHAFAGDEAISGEGGEARNSAVSADFRKQTWETKRRQFANVYVESAQIRWTYIDGDKRLLVFLLEIGDGSFKDGYSPATYITMRSWTYKAPELSANAKKATQTKATQADSSEPAVPGGQDRNFLIGKWVGSWTLNTTTYSYSYYTFGPDGTYSFAGTFKESLTGVTGTFGGGGTYTQDPTARTYTTNGTYIQQPTEGPSQYFPLFAVNISGPSQWTYSADATTLISTQAVNGVATKIVLTRK
jgi:hypothetical protein